ncbi:MAG: hypothetical protein JSV21_09495 [Nitrospirota bacterium]|nr:MAG: hypothetical protein JSV21_09495 [Nitrospirota bacterium]
MAVKNTINFVILSVNDMSQKTEDSISMLQNALFYNKRSFVTDALSLTNEIRERKDKLTKELEVAAESDPELKVYISIPAHLGRVSDLINNIADSISSKIDKQLLFSDKAVSELTFLLQRIKEILNTLTDYILARNTFIASYLKESEQEIERSATKFSTLHEERLIEGICTTNASTLYVQMLDAIKGIAWHTRKIAEELIS